MSREMNWRVALAMLLALAYASVAGRCSAQQLPPRQIIPLLNNGSLGVYQNPKAPILSKLNQPVLSFIAAAPLDVRLMQAGVPVAVDRMIVSLQPGTQIVVSVPAGQVRVNGPAPVINQYILSGWGANRGYSNMAAMTQQAAMIHQSSLQGGYNPQWGYSSHSNYNPFTNYTGFFPYQSYNESNSSSELYSWHSLASAYDFQQSQLNPQFGSFSAAIAAASPFSGFDSIKEMKTENASSDK